jgi:hypothetical protein
MEIKNIIGNNIVGIRKITSEESKTVTYSLLIFPIMIETAVGIEWKYSEISIAIIPLMRLSISFPTTD